MGQQEPAGSLSELKPMRQDQILKALRAEGGPLGASTLAMRCDIPRGSMGKLLGGMEAAGLLRHTHDAMWEAITNRPVGSTPRHEEPDIADRQTPTSNPTDAQRIPNYRERYVELLLDLARRDDIEPDFRETVLDRLDTQIAMLNDHRTLPPSD